MSPVVLPCCSVPPAHPSLQCSSVAVLALVHHCTAAPLGWKRLRQSAAAELLRCRMSSPVLTPLHSPVQRFTRHPTSARFLRPADQTRVEPSHIFSPLTKPSLSDVAYLEKKFVSRNFRPFSHGQCLGCGAAAVGVVASLSLSM